MRIGENPTRDRLIEKSDSSHRIIIPLYIPHEKDYYKDAFKIFKLCVSSIMKTSSSIVKISVVSNGCSDSINERLLDIAKEGLIDELIIEKGAIGKVNSILKALRTAQERLITVTDADVLFVNGWEEGVLEVFNAFPKAGSVSPVPVFRTHLRLTSNIWLRNFFSKKLYFRAVKNPEGLTAFAKSIGWPDLELKFKDVIATIQSKNNTIAVLGCSHFVVTYKREIFDQSPKTNSIYQLGGNSEHLYLDEPVIKMGGYRLATYDNYAFHMGNVFEPWMEDVYENLEVIDKTVMDYNTLPFLKKKKIECFFSEKIFKKIFMKKKIRSLIFKYKGLNQEQIKNFVSW